jgi:exonuclease III
MDEGSVSPPRSKRKRQQDATADCAIAVFSWNVNGISPFLEPTLDAYFKPAVKSRASLRDFLRRHNWPTFLFLQEVKINPDDSATIRAVKRAVKRQPFEPDDAYDYEARFCLPSDKFNARGFGRKVYGVCSLVRKDFLEQYVDKIRPVDWDAEGRFLVIETKAQSNMPKLAIFNVYLVNGTDNAYKDPKSGHITGTRHNRKLAVHALLQEECRKLETDGFGIIIAGDMNIARTILDGHPNLRTFPKQHCLNRADFEGKFFLKLTNERTGDEADGSTAKEADGGLAMLDTFRHLHPDRRGYTYYPRTKTFGESCDRVDMILISKSLGGQLKEAGMHETPSERGPSDHVPLYAYLDFGESADKKSRTV